VNNLTKLRMNMEIREIQSKGEWEGFLRECTQKTFLHSWAWGEFQERMREKIWRFGVFEGDELVAVALTVKVAARRGTFLLVPHGPVTRAGEARKQEVVDTLLSALVETAKEEGASFIRFNPIIERTEENERLFAAFRSAPSQMHPESSWKLNITASEDELFSGMRKTTRYVIRQALKNEDVVIEKSTDKNDVAVFHEMHKKVSFRQAFVPFSLEYLQREFETFSKDNQVVILKATVKGKLAASSFVVFWSGIGFYHHAASLKEHAKLSLPYLLQWEALKEAKARGCIVYDFWGFVDPKEQPRHPWAGPTLFKMGFGGKAYLYVKAKDYPLSLKYWITAAFETIRRLKRGL